MAKQCRVNKGNSSSEKKPDKLVMDLFSPGMTAMHRAGLGGLACSLKYIERARANLDKTMIPGEPWEENKPPWEITDRSITLNFGKPENAAGYLKSLFKASFQIKDGLIYMPGMFGAGGTPPTFLCELHNALLLTFLQHGRVRTTEKIETPLSYSVDEHPGAFITVNVKKCRDYKHQNGASEIADNLGKSPMEVIGPLNPGAIIRHMRYSMATKIVDEADRILPLYFSIVGCISLAMNKGVGILIIPEVHNLIDFVKTRPLMTPSMARECRVAGTSDAAMQLQVRLFVKRAGIPACEAIMMAPTSWASQQKSRVRVTRVPEGKDTILSLFEKATSLLPPTIVSHEISEGKGKNSTKRIVHFWTDSRIRPLIADNLAAGKPWYSGFRSLVVSKDDAETIYRENYTYSKQQPRKGVQAMMEKITWEDPGEETVVRSVHEALRMRFGRIADECRNKPAIMENRWKGERERWRLAFVGAKTLEQFRHAITDLWSRAGTNSLLRDGWQKVLPMLSPSRWQLTRDLALLAIASYAGKEVEESTETTNN